MDGALALGFLFSCHSLFLCSSDSSWSSSESRVCFLSNPSFSWLSPSSLLLHSFPLARFVRVSLGWTQGLTHWAHPALLFPPALSLPTTSLHLCLHSQGRLWLGSASSHTVFTNLTDQGQESKGQNHRKHNPNQSGRIGTSHHCVLTAIQGRLAP